MMHRRKLLMITVVILASLSSSPLYSEVIINFFGLPPGDTIEVRLDSIGCFNQTFYKLVFQADSGQRVAIYEYQREISSTIEEGWVKLGVLNLSLTDLHRLDALLVYYRKKHEGGCTTVTNIYLTQFHEGKSIIYEHLVESSCYSSIKGRADILLFDDLIFRIKNWKKSA